MTHQRPAHVLFFPLAAAYAMLALPVSVLSMQSGNPVAPGLATSAGHGHEMLFGFALAVVTGFLLTRVSRAELYILGALWLAARAAYALDPVGLLSAALNVAFAGLVAALAAPRFIRAAKKLRNQVFGPVLILVALAVLVFHGATLQGAWAWRGAVLHVAVVLFAVVMFFMGGRIIAPAAAGHLQSLGEHLEARVQPRLEGAGLLLLLAALALLAIPTTHAAAAVALLGAGAVAGVRVFRWRLWRCRGRPDLVGLGVGYAWLAAGLLLTGAALLVEPWRFTHGMHAITVGALGTLTISVMARTRLLQARQNPARAPGIPLAVGLIAIAALARITAPGWPTDAWQAYWIAAAAWAGAYLLLLRLLIRVPARA